jgi:hypothetical protein
VDVDGPVECNLLLRWVGVRLVPHLPCSFDCSRTATLGRFVARAAVESGLGRAVDWTREMLGWETSWSALNGLGLVTTPAFRFAFSTDAAPTERIIRRRGTRPDLGAGEPDPYKDNGFSSATAMDEAHGVVAKACAGLVGTYLDLGCGDGTLLGRVLPEGCRGVGVERDAAVARRGRERHPQLQLVEKTIERFALERDLEQEPFDVALLMPGRLVEMDVDTADLVRSALRLMARRVVVYAYGDWISKYGESLSRLVSAAGLKMKMGPVFAGGGVRAAQLIPGEE